MINNKEHYPVSELKLPPHNIELETAVIGSLLNHGDFTDEVMGLITSKDFYKKEHSLIFNAIEILVNENQKIDLVSVCTWLDDNNELVHVGGIEYVAELASSSVSSANLIHYAQGVKDKSLARELISVANNIASIGYDQTVKIEDKINTAQQQVMDIGSQDKSGALVKIHDLLRPVLALVEERANQGTGMVGISSGYQNLDRLTAGLPKGDLILLAGRPSMGKSTLALNIAERTALAGEVSLFFSAEMPADSLVLRTWANLGEVPHEPLRRGKLNEDDWPKIAHAINKLTDAPLFLDDTSSITVSQIRSRARREAKRQGKNIGLIVVDYIQIMNDPTANKFTNETTSVGNISKGLKAIAKEFKCPVIALSQLNRGLEQRKNKRPVMSDLRESGALEQDADIIMFVYRDEVYNPNTHLKGIAEVQIAKQRNGPLGRAYFDTELKYCRFVDRTSPVPDEPYEVTEENNFKYNG
jgi:replicative DNA helicase